MVETEQCKGFLHKLVTALIRAEGLTKFQELARVQALISLMEELLNKARRVGLTPGKGASKGDRKIGKFLFLAFGEYLLIEF